MITKLKICMIGATGVGKTSLTDRYLHSIFSDAYRTTIGVKVETQQFVRDDRVVQLVIWDMSGEDEFQSVQSAYMAGAAGYLLVVDGTRSETLDTGLVLAERVRDAIGPVPFVLVVNKADVVDAWQVGAGDLAPLACLAAGMVETSARTGTGVDEAFELLVDAILARLQPPAERPWS